MVATASDDGFLRLWTYSESSKRLMSFKKLSKPARSVSLNNDGRSVAVGFKDGKPYTGPLDHHAIQLTRFFQYQSYGYGTNKDSSCRFSDHI